MRGQRGTGKIQRNNYHHRSCGPSLTGKTLSVLKALIVGVKGLKVGVKGLKVGVKGLKGYFSVLKALKATSHSTIFDIPVLPLREDQKHRRRFTR